MIDTLPSIYLGNTQPCGWCGIYVIQSHQQKYRSRSYCALSTLAFSSCGEKDIVCMALWAKYSFWES